MSIEARPIRRFARAAAENHAGEVRFELLSDSPIALANLASHSFNPQSAAAAQNVCADVTWCLTFANDHPYLGEALKSIANQSVRPAAVIVGVDNATGDLEIAGDLDAQIRYFRERHGPFHVMDELIKRAETDFVIIQDSDDISHPDRLASLIAAAKQGQFDAVGSAVAYFDEASPWISEFGVYPHQPAVPLRREFCYPVLYPTILLRKSAYLDIGGFDRFDFFGMDLEFVIRLTRWKSVHNLHLPLYFKRWRSTALTRNMETGFGSMRRSKVDDYTKSKYQSLFSDGGFLTGAD